MCLGFKGLRAARRIGAEGARGPGKEARVERSRPITYDPIRRCKDLGFYALAGLSRDSSPFPPSSPEHREGPIPKHPEVEKGMDALAHQSPSPPFKTRVGY